jgi:hypothetical protein
MATSKEVRMRRGTTLENNAYTGPEGEVTVDTEVKTLRVQDGVTVGGNALALSNLNNVPEDTDFETRLIQRVSEMIQNGGEVYPVGNIRASFVDLGSDYLPADGRTLSKTGYPEVYAEVGDQYSSNGVGAVTHNGTLSTSVSGMTNVAFKGGTAVFISNGSSSVLTTTDGGKSWSYYALPGGTYSKVHVVNNKFVIPVSGTTYSSTDGITWTSTANTMTGTGVSNANTFSANGMIVSSDTATPTKFAYSSDGITFSSYVAAPATATTGYLDMYYSSRLGLYFISSNNGKVLSSTDLVTWTLVQATATSSVLNSNFAESGSTIVVSGGTTSAQVTYSSTDGVTWTSRTTGTTRVWDVKWAPAVSLFIVAASAGLVSTSPDGVTWTTQALATTGATSTMTWTQVIVSDEGISLYGFNSTGNAGVAMSAPSGSSTFTIRTITAATGRSWNRASYNSNSNLTWLFSDTAATYNNIISTTNTNGASFRSRWTSIVNFSSMSCNYIASTNNNGNAEVVLSTSSITTNSAYFPVLVHYTNQGDNRALTYPGLGGIRKLKTLDGKIFAVGVTGIVSYTTDGVTWTVCDTVGDGNSHIMDIAYNGVIWLVVCHNGKTFSSPDLTTWTERGTYLTTNLTDTASRNLIWTGTYWVVSNTTTSIAYTTDIDSWTVQVLGTAINDVKYGNGTVVAMSSGTNTYASTNMTTWTPSATQSGTNINQTISFGNGIFLIGGGDTASTPTTNAIVNVSVDGISWTKVDLGFKGYVRDIAFGNQMFTLVTNNGVSSGAAAGGTFYNSTSGYIWNMALQSSTVVLQKVSTTPNVAFHAGGTGLAAYLTMPDPTLFRLPNIAPSQTLGTYYIKVTD